MSERYFDELNQEYREFQKDGEFTPPPIVSEAILARVESDLNPSAWRVFSKIAAVHFLVGLVTLSLCEQLGVRLLGEGAGLMHYFMVLGPHGCMAACGAFFIGSSLLLGSWILSPDEVRALRRHRWLQVAALVLLSLGALVMADAEIVLGFALAWILGSWLGGVGMLELGWIMRFKFAPGRAG